MKQQVNLYQAEFRKTRSWKKIGVIVSAVVIVSLYSAISGYQLFVLEDLSKTLAHKNAELNTIRQSHDILKVNIKPKARDMELAMQIESLRRSNRNKQRALAFLSGDDSGNTIGFSYLLSILGEKRDRIDNIWFRKIHFSDGGFNMALLGSSYQPELLPEFIEILGDEDIYREREFRKLSIVGAAERGRRSLSEFELGTRNPDSKTDSGNQYASRVEFMNRLKFLARMGEEVQ